MSGKSFIESVPSSSEESAALLILLCQTPYRCSLSSSPFLRYTDRPRGEYTCNPNVVSRAMNENAELFPACAHANRTCGLVTCKEFFVLRLGRRFLGADDEAVSKCGAEKDSTSDKDGSSNGSSGGPPAPQHPKRSHGTDQLNPLRVGADAARSQRK